MAAWLVAGPSIPSSDQIATASVAQPARRVRAHHRCPFPQLALKRSPAPCAVPCALVANVGDDGAAVVVRRRGAFRMNNSPVACHRLHFAKVVQPWTDVSLGNCSYLDTCRNMRTCKYVHYQVRGAASRCA